MHRADYGVTAKAVALVAVPAGVGTWTLPVVARLGTVAGICVFVTENVVAATPPNVTFFGPVKLVPVMVTVVPTGPLVGLTLWIKGLTMNLGSGLV